MKAKGWRQLGTLAELDDAQLRMRNSLKMGLYINVAGMLLALIGAEQIVGTLVAKVLYSQGEARSTALARTIIYFQIRFFFCVFCVCFLPCALCASQDRTIFLLHGLLRERVSTTAWRPLRSDGQLSCYSAVKMAVGAIPPSKFDKNMSSCCPTLFLSHLCCWEISA